MEEGSIIVHELVGEVVHRRTVSIMEGLKDSVGIVAEALADAEKKRDLALAESRKIIRLSKNVIHAIHVGSDYGEPMAEMEERMRSLVSNVSEDMLLHGPAGKILVRSE